jgi:hypothetical protein
LKSTFGVGIASHTDGKGKSDPNLLVIEILNALSV